MQIIYAYLSNLPETIGLLGVGFVLILGGVVLRRAIASFEHGISAANQTPEPKERALE